MCACEQKWRTYRSSALPMPYHSDVLFNFVFMLILPAREVLGVCHLTHTHRSTRIVLLCQIKECDGKKIYNITPIHSITHYLFSGAIKMKSFYCVFQLLSSFAMSLRTAKKTENRKIAMRCSSSELSPCVSLVLWQNDSAAC